ncbi:integrase [Escherichia coli]|uniref:integrase n=1 Tax=Escherichia coli TaxID=562 RepID=UPI001021BA69|nr:integrase [Escherichia coli]
MLRIGQVEATATQDGKYTDGSVAGGIAATRLRAAAFNAMQEELAHIVESAGLALDINDMTQVLKAIQKLTLSRANPFADIKSDGAAAISTALTNLGLGAGAPPIGIPFFWPTSAMPNTVMPEWSDMVFLKLNDATFSATTYPKLALVWPGLKLTDTRGEFIRIWDDGRGVDSGRALLSAQGDAMQRMTGSLADVVYQAGQPSTALTGPFSGVGNTPGLVSPGTQQTAFRTITVSFDTQNAARTASETRSRNIAFNFLVRAK